MGWGGIVETYCSQSRDWSLDHMMPPNIGLVPNNAPKHGRQSEWLLRHPAFRLTCFVKLQPTGIARFLAGWSPSNPQFPTWCFRAFVIPVFKLLTRDPLAKRSCDRCRAPEGI